MLHCNERSNAMAGAIVSIAQQKGGAGKTTVAVQLGVAWLSAGGRVAMLDIDPQASLFTWSSVRRRRFGDVADGLRDPPPRPDRARRHGPA
jgi:cellulose biosynthesis protein BcsQ